MQNPAKKTINTYTRQFLSGHYKTDWTEAKISAIDYFVLLPHTIFFFFILAKVDLVKIAQYGTENKEVW